MRKKTSVADVADCQGVYSARRLIEMSTCTQLNVLVIRVHDLIRIVVVHYNREKKRCRG